MSFTAESGQSQTELDNLETSFYATDGALQAVWVKTGTDEAVRDSVVKAIGSDMSMKLDASKANGEWAAATTNMPVNDASIDMTNAIISFKFRQNSSFSNLKANMFIKDSGANKSVVSLVVDDNNIDSFVTFSIPISLFTSGTPADITDVVTIGFEVDDQTPTGLFYVDSLTFIISAGTIRMKLWDFGSTAPVAGTSKLSDATQYQTLGDLGFEGASLASQVDVNLLPGKRLYHVHDFVAGPALEKGDDNIPVIVDNYYAITFHHVDEDVIFYGNNDGKLADSGGYSFTAEDEATAIVATGEDENLQFYIFCTKAVYLAGYHLHMLDSDGEPTTTGQNSEWTTIIEDSNEKPVIIDEHHHHAVSDYLFEGIAEKMELGGKFETKYVPGTDDITFIVQEIFYYYKKIEVLA